MEVFIVPPSEQTLRPMRPTLLLGLLHENRPVAAGMFGGGLPQFLFVPHKFCFAQKKKLFAFYS